MNKRKADPVRQPAKRVRVSRACDQCRAGREKCDGQQPCCQTCSLQNRQCSYDEQPKKRGIQPNYIRTLESSLAWICRSFPDSANQLTRHLVAIGKDAELHSTWRTSIVARQIEQVLSGAEADLPLDLPTDLSQEPDSTVRKHGTIPVSEEPTISELPSESWNLLEHYFAFTHSWFPIVEKHDVLKLMYTYPAGDAPEHAEVWSIMALAAFQRGCDETQPEPSRARATTPPTREEPSFARQESAWMKAESYRRTARSLIPIDKGPYHISHVKALLILGLVEMMRSEWLAAWSLTGTAIRILAYLNARGSHPERAKHVCLAAFLLERLAASWTGARMYLHSSQVHNAGLLPEDGLDEWSPWNNPRLETAVAKSPVRSISTFNTLVRIAASPHKLVTEGAGADDAVNIVLKLLENACSTGKGAQPSNVVASLLINARQSNEFGALVQHSQNGAVTARSRASQGPRSPEVPSLFWDTASSDITPIPIRAPGSFITVPHDVAESLPRNTPIQPPAALMPSPWTDETSMLVSLPPPDEIRPDIFEELAMLERADSASHPDFMENLGFGADLDLADFFGADYQPVDSLAPYLNTQSNGLANDNSINGVVK